MAGKSKLASGLSDMAFRGGAQKRKYGSPVKTPSVEARASVRNAAKNAASTVKNAVGSVKRGAGKAKSAASSMLGDAKPRVQRAAKAVAGAVKDANNLKGVKQTKAGAYPVYAKKSEKAQSFRSAFADARKAGKKEFTWNGRRYNTKVK